MPNYIPNLNSPKTKKILHALLGRSSESRLTIWEALKVIRKDNPTHPAIELLLEGLDDISDLESMIHTLGNDYGYQIIDRLIEEELGSGENHD